MEDKTSLVAKKKRKLTLGSQVSKREHSKYINYNSSLLRSTYSCLVETNEELKPPKGLKIKVIHEPLFYSTIPIENPAEEVGQHPLNTLVTIKWINELF